MAGTRCLCTAVRDRLRSVLGLKDSECDLTMPGGQPPPSCGEWFYGVWAGGSQGQGATALDRTYEVTVTLTARTARAPRDRQGPALMYAEAAGFYDRVDALAEVVAKDSRNCHVMNRANVLLGDPLDGNEPVGFRVALAFLGGSVPRLVGPDWFSAQAEGHYEVGVVADLRFGRARRVQNLANVQG